MLCQVGQNKVALVDKKFDFWAFETDQLMKQRKHRLLVCMPILVHKVSIWLQKYVIKQDT